MYLRISEKYQIYKDLSDRCLINTAHIGMLKLFKIKLVDKGDKRVFYLKP